MGWKAPENNVSSFLVYRIHIGLFTSILLKPIGDSGCGQAVVVVLATNRQNGRGGVGAGAAREDVGGGRFTFLPAAAVLAVDAAFLVIPLQPKGVGVLGSRDGERFSG